MEEEKAVKYLGWKRKKQEERAESSEVGQTLAAPRLKKVRQWQLRVERLISRARDEEWEQQGSSGE